MGLKVPFKIIVFALVLNNFALCQFFKRTILAYDSIISNGGKIEGGIAAGNDIIFNGGVEFIGINHLNQKYTIIAGRDLKWVAGNLNKNVKIFVGRDILRNTPEHISEHVSENCFSDDGEYPCLDDLFSSQFMELQKKSKLIIEKPINTASKLDGNVLTITGVNYPYSNSFYMDIPATQWNEKSNIKLNNIKIDAYSNIYITISGKENVIFKENSFPYVRNMLPDQIIYNIPGNRLVFIRNTHLFGNILAPASDIIQENGLIEGALAGKKVTVSNIIPLEIK